MDVLLKVVTSSECRRQKETEFRQLRQLDTAFTSVVIAAGSKGEKGNIGLDWQ